MISVVCSNVPLYFNFLTWPAVVPEGDYVFKFEDRIGDGLSEGSYFEIRVTGDSIAKVKGAICFIQKLYQSQRLGVLHSQKSTYRSSMVLLSTVQYAMPLHSSECISFGQLNIMDNFTRERNRNTPLFLNSVSDHYDAATFQ
jgi:hypothetical protein